MDLQSLTPDYTAVDTAMGTLQAFLGPIPYGGHEGYRHFKYGLRSGPSYGIDHLLHEVCHAAQLKEHEIKRVNAYGWGFRTPQRLVAGQVVFEPTTTKISEREAEVWGMQARLAHHLFGADPIAHMDGHATLSSFMPDQWAYPVKYVRGEYEQACAAWLRGRIQYHYDRYTPELVRDLFIKNNALILAHHSST